MEIYDSLIRDVNEKLKDLEFKSYTYNPENRWPESEQFEMVMQKDMALEIGSFGKPAYNFTCVTTNEDAADKDEVLVYGSDISDKESLKEYLRIAIVVTEPGEETEKNSKKLHKHLEDVEFVKYHVYPKGVSLRTSGQSIKEQLRITKEAMEKEISFEKLGNTFISCYKQNPAVKKVKIIFVTDPRADYKAFEKMANLSVDIRKSLSEILKGMPTDCGTCSIAKICSEVEGMKKLHFGSREEQGAN